MAPSLTNQTALLNASKAFWHLPGLLACLVNKHGKVTTASAYFIHKLPSMQDEETLSERLLHQGLTSEAYARFSLSLDDVLAQNRNFGGDLIHFDAPTQIYALYSIPVGSGCLMKFQPVTHTHQLTHERTLLDHLLNLSTPVAMANHEGSIIRRNHAFTEQFLQTKSLLSFLDIDLEQLRQIIPLHHRHWHEHTLGNLPYDIQLGAYPDETGHMLYYVALHDVSDRVAAQRAQRETALVNLRQDLAHHLHDRVAQYLAFMHMKFASWTDDEAPSPHELKSLHQALQSALTETRLIINHLRQGTDATHSHPLTLGDVLTQARGMMGLTVTLQGEDIFTALPMAQQLLLCTILFEALCNARRHAGTNQVQVYCDHTAGGTHLKVHDNGRGFDTALLPDMPNKGHFGLRTIQDRLRSAGGSITIDSQPKQGTRLTIFMPNHPTGDSL